MALKMKTLRLYLVEDIVLKRSVPKDQPPEGEEETEWLLWLTIKK